ncbi:MAG TPA: hypothetical protein VE641_19955 [Chthoniobacterales bacterium]|jgi:hypothetical protein|nr:hypothetical protein [Chthoniobacterales bacterium]
MPSRRKIKRGPGTRVIRGQDLVLADELAYIRVKAAEYSSCVVGLGKVILFSTESGDAWLLDPAECLAARVACDGHPEPIHSAETEKSYAIEWRGRYRIDGDAFTYFDNESGRVTTLHGYPTTRILDTGLS